MNDLPIIAVAKRLVVEDTDVPWDFLCTTPRCSHQLLRQIEPGRYACESCPRELLVRPLRKRGAAG